MLQFGFNNDASQDELKPNFGAHIHGLTSKESLQSINHSVDLISDNQLSAFSKKKNKEKSIKKE